jgi:tRNA(Ile2) C34 agmatinyltransferase TiaS
MKEEILDITKKLYHNHLTPETATNLLLRLFDVRRSDSPKCDKCGADETKQSCIGKWEDGEEYRCDECGNEWEFHHFA